MERRLSPVETQYLNIKRGQIVEQVLISSLVLEWGQRENDHLSANEKVKQDRYVERHKKLIAGSLEAGRHYGFKPSEIIGDVQKLLAPPEVL